MSDFTAGSKCKHINNNVCDLQSSKNDSVGSNQSDENNTKNLTDNNYITANGQLTQSADEQRSPNSICSSNGTIKSNSSSERSISDSILSLRNYSTILHSSNHQLYKTQSPCVLAKDLLRQTSTPMQQNIVVIKTPESNECCHSYSISTSTGQVSIFHSSDQFDTSDNQRAIEPKPIAYVCKFFYNYFWAVFPIF